MTRHKVVAIRVRFTAETLERLDRLAERLRAAGSLPGRRKVPRSAIVRGAVDLALRRGIDLALVEEHDTDSLRDSLSTDPVRPGREPGFKRPMHRSTLFRKVRKYRLDALPPEPEGDHDGSSPASSRSH